MKVLNVNAPTRLPVALSKMPIDVLTTSPFSSGGWPSPQLAKSRPSKLAVGPGAGALTIELDVAAPLEAAVVVEVPPAG